MGFVEFYRLALVFRIWSHLTMKYADGFRFEQVSRNHSTYNYPILPDLDRNWEMVVDDSLSSSYLGEAGPRQERIEVVSYIFYGPKEESPLLDDIWVFEVCEMRIGIGHESQAVLYTDFIVLEERPVYVGDAQDAGDYLWRYENLFDGEEWWWNELK